MNELALYAGAGGSIIAGKLLGWKTVCAVEYEPYCQSVLLARQADGILEPFPIWDDVRTFDGFPWRGKVDVLTAGFPCTPWSSSGKKEGEKSKDNMWPDTIRIIKEVQPTYVMLENSDELPGKPYFARIIEDLGQAGYFVEWPAIFAATDVGAWHERNRVWVVAHLTQIGCGQDADATWEKWRDDVHPDAEDLPNASSPRRDQGQPSQSGKVRNKSGGEKPQRRTDYHADLNTQGLPLFQGGTGTGMEDRRSEPCVYFGWDSEPGMGRVVHGLAHRVDRVKALGNGWVPQVGVTAWKWLSKEANRG
jgi:DNA (cytosine-5)-methyltransferase 1